MCHAERAALLVLGQPPSRHCGSRCSVYGSVNMVLRPGKAAADGGNGDDDDVMVTVVLGCGDSSDDGGACLVL